MEYTLNYLWHATKSHLEYWYLFFFTISWLISNVSFPTIIKISNEKNLVATPSERSSHSKKTPTLGGIGIFIGFIISITLFGSLFENVNVYPLLSCIVILFFLGLKDDILELSARKKFSVQLISIIILTINSKITIKSLFGFFGIYGISDSFSIFLTIFIFILFINAYNLIDGVDGLAGTVAICFLLVSSLLFYIAKSSTLCVISLALMGSIIAFLKYNFSNKKKIFMGDTGSMIVGFVLTYLMINLINIGKIEFETKIYNINPILLLSLLFFPLLDTARVFFVRLIIYKKNPFSADKNHIHHSLLKLGFKHWQISLFVGIATYILFIISLLIENYNIHFQLLFIIIIGAFIFSTPQILHKMKETNFNFLKNTTLIITLTSTFIFFNLVLQKKTCYIFKLERKIQ